MKQWWARVSDGVLVIAAVLTAAMVARREFYRPLNVDNDREANEFIENWRELVHVGVPYGNPNARYIVVEFGDLECPACKSFNQQLQGWKARLKDDVAVVFVHYPLSQHRFAMPAAKALECAHEQVGSAAFLDVLYAQQDSFGLKPWRALAVEAGVGSPELFDACVGSKREFARISQGIAAGRAIKVLGTPTIVINGWRLGARSDPDQVLTAITKGEAPFGEYRTVRYKLNDDNPIASTDK